MQVELTPTDRGRVLVNIRDDEDKPLYSDRIDPQSARARVKPMKTAGVSETVFLAWCEQTRIANKQQAFTVEVPVCKENVPVFLTRPRDGQDVNAERHECSAEDFVRKVLPKLPQDILGKWSDADVLCCLDVDYHDKPPPTQDWLENVVLTRLVPKPYAWHLSKGGGLHAFYLPATPYTAKELAAVAALRYRCIDPSAGLELKTAVFGPGDKAYHVATLQDTAASALPWFGTSEYDDAEREDWLESHGMLMDARYAHDMCPIHPVEESHGTPVCVNAAGIFCFKCEATGHSLGCRKPGFATWAALLGSPSSGDLGALVRNIVHWGHARWVLKYKYDLPESLARYAYSAALKAYHYGTDRASLVEGVFSANTVDLARVGTRWVNLKSGFGYPKDILPLLNCLPKVRYVDEEGKVKVDPAAACLLSQMDDHSERGYSPINVIQGFKMTEQYLSKPTDPTTVPVVNPELVSTAAGRCNPRYVPKAKRMKEDEAWAVIETVLPQIDRTLVKVALASFACAQETRAGMQPIVFVTGATGAAKTSTIKVAAAIYGSRSHDVVFEGDPSRMRQNVKSGADTCAAVIFNEILKDSSRGKHKMSPREALDPLLNFTEDSSSWIAYVGPVKMGRLPALFLTEPVCPATIREETQLARRIRHHKIFGEKKMWKQTIPAAGVGANLHLLRTASVTVNAACDAILSSLCDEFFSTPLTWDFIADTLGVRTILESPDFDDNSDAYLKEFFRFVCLAPDLEGALAKRYSDGYKRVSREACEKDSPSDQLLTVYTMFADGGGNDWLNSRRLLEKDWSSVLKTPVPVQLDLTSDGVSVYARFRSGPVKSPETLVNKQIVDPTDWESML